MQRQPSPRIPHFEPDHKVWLVAEIAVDKHSYYEIAVRFTRKFDMEAWAPGVPEAEIIPVVQKRCKHVKRGIRHLLEEPPAEPETEDAETATEPPTDLEGKLKLIDRQIRDVDAEWDTLMNQEELTSQEMGKLSRAKRTLEELKGKTIDNHWKDDSNDHISDRYHAGDGGPKFSTYKTRDSDGDGRPLFSNLNKPNPERNGEAADALVQLPVLSAPVEQPRESKETAGSRRNTKRQTSHSSGVGSAGVVEEAPDRRAAEFPAEITWDMRSPFHDSRPRQMSHELEQSIRALYFQNGFPVDKVAKELKKSTSEIKWAIEQVKKKDAPKENSPRREFPSGGGGEPDAIAW